MERGKIVAVITGAIAIALSLVYLLVVQLLDFRGEMLPAPTGCLTAGAIALLDQPSEIRTVQSAVPTID